MLVDLHSTSGTSFSSFPDASNNPHHLCLISYRLSAGFIPSLSYHGNSKDKKPFHPTWPSTLTQVKEECLAKGPKATVEQVSSEVGGVLRASASAQLPRNEKQVANQRRRVKTAQASGHPMNAAADDLFVIMQRAHTQDPTHQFVRDIKTAPEPAIVLACDHQLQDFVCFTTSSFEFGIVTIDPTFTLGEFDVTPLTYMTSSLGNKTQQAAANIPRSRFNPLQGISTYLFFASSLIGQCPQLEGIRAFGTDGEQPLIDAISHELGFSHMLYTRQAKHQRKTT